MVEFTPGAIPSSLTDWKRSFSVRRSIGETAYVLRGGMLRGLGSERETITRELNVLSSSERMSRKSKKAL